ncbi:hypothetical protein GCM10010472_68870 [Pseudonocardia halophobica]|uniref:Transposase IS116/IS110/IS902 family protein n=1 Tax=Pseudonocardia halophobica TaxID=29401 RepID=A0A9W6L5E8_9PSEU|nr:transposase [Pseudonocardia halophobica]GLL12544.1 hypothetical protein GCM10017577_36850 [Pseudonocardia halophobica]
MSVAPTDRSPRPPEHPAGHPAEHPAGWFGPATAAPTGGIDWASDTHAVAVVAGDGTPLDRFTVPHTRAGLRGLCRRLHRVGVDQVGIERGDGPSFAVVLLRGVSVVVARRRSRSFVLAALRALHLDLLLVDDFLAWCEGRAGTEATGPELGSRPALVLRMARNSAVNASTKATNQLKAVLVGADPALRESLAGLGPATLVRRCAELPGPSPGAGDLACTVVFTQRTLAARILALKAEAYHLHKRLRALVTAHAPALIARRGIGPDSAAALLIATGDNPERLHAEGAYAALYGVSPVQASSGRTQRLRLDRGSDRQANAALYRITLSRLRWDPRTQQYLQRRLAEGKIRCEMIRCLKRYIARDVFSLLTPPTTATVATRTKTTAAWHP